MKPRRGWEKEIAFTNRCLCLFYIYDPLLPYNQQKIFYNYFTFKSRNYTEYNSQITIMANKGIGPRGLGTSPIKQTKKQKRKWKAEYSDLSEVMENFDEKDDTLIIGRSNSTSGADFSNNAKRTRAIDKGLMKRTVDESTMLQMPNGQFKYVTQHEKK